MTVPAPRRRILCFGDSNTYGYDPRSFLGDRYPAQVRWTGILNAVPGWALLNHGENGREVPFRPGELARVDSLLDRAGRLDCVTVMLGSNDLLQNPEFSAEDVADRMEGFLRRLADHPVIRDGGTRLLLIAPPPMVPGAWVGEARLLTQSARLGGCYGALAQRLGIAFADAGNWGVGLTFDGVHFSEAGHRAFAAGAEAALRPLLEG